MREVEFIDLRDELRAVKTETIDRIDFYLDQFKMNAERAERRSISRPTPPTPTGS